jgi:hypothetical protein
LYFQAYEEFGADIKHFDGNQIKYVFDDHETYSNDDKDVLQFVLNLYESSY